LLAKFLFYVIGIRKTDKFCKPLSVIERTSLDFLVQAKHISKKLYETGNAGLTRETFQACIQRIEAMIELVSYLHNKHDFRYNSKFIDFVFL